MANRQDIINYAKETYGTSIEYLWASSPTSGVLRHSHNNKWYAAILEAPKNKVGVEGDGWIDILDIKCEPDMVATLAVQEGFAPAYHMNKKHWVTIVLDGRVDDEMIYNLLDLSYELTR